MNKYKTHNILEIGISIRNYIRQEYKSGDLDNNDIIRALSILIASLRKIETASGFEHAESQACIDYLNYKLAKMKHTL